MAFMNRNKGSWRLFRLSLFILAIFFISYYFFPEQLSFFSSRKTLNFSHATKSISLIDDGNFFPATTQAATVADFLQEQNIPLTDMDDILPSRNARLYPGIFITIHRAIPLEIKVDGKILAITSTAPTVYGALQENAITLGRLDTISQPLYARFTNGDVLTITRINVEEKVIAEDIPYKTIHKEDAKLGWREEKTQQSGKKGIREVKYKITYKNNKEISRVVLEKNITQEPIDAIITKGTYMKLGKAANGQGTWYAYQGGLFAASTSIPRGSFAKVTNTATGKSVVVQINDYGPQGKGRIIDLDKVAFAKIASIGAGVIGVKVEQVLN
jgi:uncharacterized protein YabE (DUF348 family)